MLLAITRLLLEGISTGPLGNVSAPPAPNVQVDVLLEPLLVVCMTASTLGIPDSTTEPS